MSKSCVRLQIVSIHKSDRDNCKFNILIIHSVYTQKLCFSIKKNLTDQHNIIYIYIISGKRKERSKFEKPQTVLVHEFQHWQIFLQLQKNSNCHHWHFRKEKKNKIPMLCLSIVFETKNIFISSSKR